MAAWTGGHLDKRGKKPPKNYTNWLLEGEEHVDWYASKHEAQHAVDEMVAMYAGKSSCNAEMSM